MAQHTSSYIEKSIEILNHSCIHTNAEKSIFILVKGRNTSEQVSPFVSTDTTTLTLCCLLVYLRGNWTKSGNLHCEGKKSQYDQTHSIKSGNNQIRKWKWNRIRNIDISAVQELWETPIIVWKFYFLGLKVVCHNRHCQPH